MDDKILIKFFRLLAYLFDLAIVTLIFFLFLFYPIGLLNADSAQSLPLNTIHVMSLVLAILLAGITIFLYFFIPMAIFKGSTFGMKLFYIKLMADDKKACTNKMILKRSFIIFLFLILSFGLSLISDIISIIFSSSSRTFSDALFDVKVVKLNFGKEN